MAPPYATLEENSLAYTQACQVNAPWHLSQVSHGIDGQSKESYPFDEPQTQTSVYVVDTWMDLAHREFNGRAVLGAKFIEGSSHSHATHVAGLIGGNTVGINRKAKLISVQVLDDKGSGAWSVIIQGLQWISQQKDVGIINMSLGGGASPALDAVLVEMTKRGWSIVVAAGNSNADACGTSPARVPSVVTVGASTQTMSWAAFSNYGKCVDIAAPGESILSAYPQQRYAYMSGTSMASPIVAGLWSLKPWLNMKEFLKEYESVGVLDKPLPAGTANKFVYGRVSANIDQQCQTVTTTLTFPDVKQTRYPLLDLINWWAA